MSVLYLLKLLAIPSTFRALQGGCCSLSFCPALSLVTFSEASRKSIELYLFWGDCRIMEAALTDVTQRLHPFIPEARWIEVQIDFDYGTFRARTSAGPLQNKTNCILHCIELYPLFFKHVSCWITSRRAIQLENSLGILVVSDALGGHQGNRSLTYAVKFACWVV